jgi:transposase
MARGATRDRGKERSWRRTLGQWRRSGQSVRDFCLEHDLSEPSFYAWRRTIAERDRQSASRNGRADVVRQQRPSDADSLDKPIFIPLHVVPATTAPPLEVVLGQGRVIRVPAGFDAATLRQLLGVLEEPSC